MAAAILGPLLVILAAGYLAVQLELAEIGAPLLDSASQPTAAVGSGWPYLLRIGLVLLAVVAVVAYRAVNRSRLTSLVTLIVLVIAALVGSYTLHPLPSGGQPESMIWLSFIYGATSPFTLALIGAVTVNLIAGRRGSRPNS